MTHRYFLLLIFVVIFISLGSRSLACFLAIKAGTPLSIFDFLTLVRWLQPALIKKQAEASVPFYLY